MTFQRATVIVVGHDHISGRKHVVPQPVAYRLHGLHQQQIVLFHQVPAVTVSASSRRLSQNVFLKILARWSLTPRWSFKVRRNLTHHLTQFAFGCSDTVCNLIASGGTSLFVQPIKVISCSVTMP